MKRRRVRRRCQQIVRDFELPSPFDVYELCRSLGDKRGRPIVLLPWALPPDSPCGLWVAATKRDYVFYQQDTSGPHRLQIILHELGHVVCGHGIGSTLSDVLGLLFPDLDADLIKIMLGPVPSDDVLAMLIPELEPDLITAVRGRSHYSQENEHEAETIATLILGQVSRFSPERTFDVPAEAAEVVGRISRSIAQ